VASLTIQIADTESRRLRACLSLLRNAKGIQTIGTARTAQEAIAGARAKPHILLFDLKLMKDNGILPLVIIRTRSPQTKVILLTGRAPEEQILQAISYGARGYLSAKLLRRFLIKAVRAVNAGETWVSRAMVAKIIDSLAQLTAKQSRPPRLVS
jgi:DNA-binding NarL/FixJ family response regulator